MKTIYNAEGAEKILDAVDAKEHVATARWFFEKPEPKKEEKTFDEQVFSDDAHINAEEKKPDDAQDSKPGKGRPKKQNEV